MNEIVIKLLKEIGRALAAAFLAYIGIESTGCIALGDGSNASLVHQVHTAK